MEDTTGEWDGTYLNRDTTYERLKEHVRIGLIDSEQPASESLPIGWHLTINGRPLHPDQREPGSHLAGRSGRVHRPAGPRAKRTRGLAVLAVLGRPGQGMVTAECEDLPCMTPATRPGRTAT
jgi:hypothetical protein